MFIYVYVVPSHQVNYR